jgi:rhamnosyltransferase subunit B
MREHPTDYFLATAGTAGDIYPFLGLAKALQSMGRRVTLLGTAFHRPMVEFAGVPFIGVGSERDYLEAIGNPDIWHHRRGFSVLFRNYGRQLIEGATRLREAVSTSRRPIVISHFLTMPAALIARECGAAMRIVSVALAPTNLRSFHDPMSFGPSRMPSWVPMSVRRSLWRLVERALLGSAIAGVNKARLEFGLKPVARYFAHIESGADLTLTLFPSWFGPTQPDWPRPLQEGRFVLHDAAAGSPLSERLSAFLAAGDPPVIFTAGTGHAHAHEHFRSAAEACARVGCRAVLLTRFREQVPDSLPESVCWQPYAPFGTLLPRAAALVHHGGIGTSAEALRAGVPQLVMPFAFDQFDNAMRLQDLGVGRMLPAASVNARRLARELGDLLRSEQARRKAAEIAQRLRHPPALSELCEQLERRLLPALAQRQPDSAVASAVLQ